MIFDWRWLLPLLLLIAPGCNDDIDRYNEAVAAAELDIQAVSLTPGPVILGSTETQQMTFDGTRSDGSTYDLGARARWETGDPSIATVDGNGLVTAITDGSTFVRASFAQFSAQQTVNVSNADLTGLAIGGVSSLSVCRPSQFTLTGSFSDGSTRPVRDGATWTIEPATAGIIDNSGNLTVKQAGIAEVTVVASKNGITTNKVVNVAADLQQIELAAPALNIEIDNSITLTATGVYADGSRQTLTSANWISADSAIASVDASGQVTGKFVGGTTVTASCGGVSRAITVTVLPAAEVIAIEIESGQGEIKVKQGNELKLDASAILSTGIRRIVTDEATWSVETVQGGPITVGNDAKNKGEVDTRNTGEAFIKAEYQNETARIKVLVE